jgi:hypothetical protein
LIVAAEIKVSGNLQDVFVVVKLDAFVGEEFSWLIEQGCQTSHLLSVESRTSR